MNVSAVRTVARRRLCFLGPVIAAIAALPVQGSGAVVVVSNKTPQRVEFVISHGTRSKQEQALDAFDLTAVPCVAPSA